MQFIKKVARNSLIIWMGVIGVLVPTFVLADASNLTLLQAEQAALIQAPEIQALQAKKQALAQQAISAGQLSDPKLVVGAMNVPVDTFNFSQEPMTQVAVGLQQAFPKGHSLKYQSLQKQSLSEAEDKQSKTTQLEIFRAVRLSWLDLYYWLQARRVIQQQQKVFRHLVSVTESMLANNKAQQKDVIRAQLELTDLDNQLIQVQQNIDTARANLARWIGAPLAAKANPRELPRWPKPNSMAQLQEAIKHHPTLQSDSSMIAAGQAKVEWAEQQFKPGFSVGVAYGFRQGRNLDGSRRSDFLTAEVTMDLPIFPGNRQSRELNAAEDNLNASQDNQISHYRTLNQNLDTQYAVWKNLSKSSWLYQHDLIPQAEQYAEATLSSYQNDQTDFPTLARSYILELKDKLSGLKAQVGRDKAHANLLYLEGK